MDLTFYVLWIYSYVVRTTEVGVILSVPVVLLLDGLGLFSNDRSRWLLISDLKLRFLDRVKQRPNYDRAEQKEDYSRNNRRNHPSPAGSNASCLEQPNRPIDHDRNREPEKQSR